MKQLITATLLIATAAVTGCSKEQSGTTTTESSNVANFSASIIETRTDFDAYEWIKDSDVIGITTYGFASEYENIPYKATTSAASTDFTAVVEADQILYPNVAPTKYVVFFAYYPYSDNNNFVNLGGDGYYITHDISGQKDNLAGVDLMTAKVGDGMTGYHYYVGKEYEPIQFGFEHNLVKVFLTITRNDNCPSLEGLAVTLENAYTTATHAANAGTIKDTSNDSYSATGDIPLTVEDGVDTATVTALLHPLTSPDTQTLRFTLGTNVYSVVFAPDYPAKSSAGCSFSYTIALGNDEAVFTGSTTIGDWTGDGGNSSLYPEESTN